MTNLPMKAWPQTPSRSWDIMISIWSISTNQVRFKLGGLIADSLNCFDKHWNGLDSTTYQRIIPHDFKRAAESVPAIRLPCINDMKDKICPCVTLEFVAKRKKIKADLGCWTCRSPSNTPRLSCGESWFNIQKRKNQPLFWFHGIRWLQCCDMSLWKGAFYSHTENFDSMELDDC